MTKSLSNWQHYAVQLDKKIKEIVVKELAKVPGVLLVVDYSNFEKKTASPRPGSDLDLIIVVDSTKPLTVFKETVEYYQQTYKTLFRHTPWIIPSNLWQEYLSAQPYNTPRVMKYLTVAKEIPTEKLFFSYYELLLDSLFSALYEASLNSYGRYFQKYLARTKQNLSYCYKYFYPADKVQAHLKLSESLPLSNSPIKSLHTLKQEAEKLSDNLAKKINLAFPKEQIQLPFGWKTALFFISPANYSFVNKYFSAGSAMSIRVINSSLLAYSYALASSASPSKSGNDYQKEFVRRKLMTNKWMAFRKKHALQKLSSTPYGYSLLEVKQLHF